MKQSIPRNSAPLRTILPLTEHKRTVRDWNCMFTTFTISEQKLNNTLKPAGPEKPLSVTERSYCTWKRYQLLHCHLVQQPFRISTAKWDTSFSWWCCCQVFWEITSLGWRHYDLAKRSHPVRLCSITTKAELLIFRQFLNITRGNSY